MPQQANRPKFKSRKSAGRKGVVNLIYRVLLVFISVFLFSQSIRSIQLTDEKLNIMELAQAEVDQLRLKNIALIDESSEVISEDYIETIARNRLNYSRDGEISFVIPEDVLDDTHINQYIDHFSGYYIGEDTKTSDNDQFWRVWLDFVLTGA